MKILKSLDPHYLIHRLATDQIVGVLADQDLGSLAEADMLLADGEVVAGGEPQAHAVVKIRKGVRFSTGEDAVQKLGEKLDPFMARTFGASSDPVWFHPLASVETWEESAVVKGLEVPTRIQKADAPAHDEEAMSDLSAEDLGTVARLLDFHADIDGAEELVEIVKAEYDRRGLDVDESLIVFARIEKAGPFARWGGSAKYASKVAAMLPTHDVYIEPFCGAASVFFAKNPAPKSVLCDTDPELVNALKMIQKADDELVSRLNRRDLIVSESQWKKIRNNIPTDPLDRLHRFLYLSGGSWSGVRGSNPNSAKNGKPAYNPDRILRFSESLKNTEIRQLDYRSAMEKYDGSDALFFIDPPYPGEWTPKADDNKDDGRKFDLDELVQKVNALKGKWVVVLGDSESQIKAIKSMGGRTFAIETTEARSVSGGGPKRANHWFATNVKDISKAVWSTAFQNDLPDSSFLLVEAGGEKDEEGKTVPRTLRHIPVRDEDGKLDLAHVRNAIAQIPKLKIPGFTAEDKAKLQDKARALLEETKKKLTSQDADRIEKGLFGYPAGKHVMSKKLATMIPDHRVYVEPFIGSGAVLFAKEKSEVEVVNDMDPEVADAWRILSRLSADGIKKIQAMSWVSSRDRFRAMVKSSPSGDLEKLHRFLYCAAFSFGRRRGIGYATDTAGKTSTMPQKLEKLAPRYRGVNASCGDYEKVCLKYDGKDSFFFLDPPYAGYDTDIGEGAFDEQRFFDFLCKLKGNWLLTYGERGKLPGLLRSAGYTVKRWDISRLVSTTRGKEGDKTLGQIIAYNYEIPKVEKAAPRSALCFYHRDLDGVASAAVVLQAHPEAELVGITYGEDFPWGSIKDREIVYMVDFGLQPFEDMVKLKAALDEQGTKFLWIDHHVTAIDAAEKAGFEAEGLRKIGEAGCELTWKFLHPDEPVPEAVRLVGRFDVWDHSDKNVVPIHYAMEATKDANDPSSSWWAEGLQKGADDFGELVDQGESIVGWLDQFNAGRMRHSAFELEFAGLKCVAACTSIPGSLQFESVRGEHDAALAFSYSPGNRWDVGMFALKDGVDVGKICADNGGGGHKGVGGFQCKELPFDLPAATQKAYDLREPLAAYAHGSWSRWMDHLFSRTDDAGAISTEDAERWKRLIATPYEDLTEEEKESDRLEADRMLEVMSGRPSKPVEKKDGSTDPVAKNFAPVLPGAENSFDDVNALLKDFVTDEVLAVGLGVAPKWTGEVAVVHAVGGKVILTIGSDSADKAEAFPEIVAAASKIGESFVLVGDMLGSGSAARLVVRDVLHWGDQDPAKEPWEARQKTLSQVLPAAVGPVVPSPVRLVHSLDKLKAAITWSSEVPGSEGAVITVANSTSDPGGPSSSVAEVRIARIVNALVVGVDSNTGGSRTYRCVVGPLSDSDSNRMKDTVEIDGRNYTPIGSTSPTSVEASEGNVLRVEVGEILVVDSTESAAIGWDLAKVLERVHVKPATVPEIRALARPHEIQKLCKIIKRDSARHYILSVVLEPNDGDDGAPLDPDAHNEIYSDDEIWDACVYWYEKGSQIGVMHERDTTIKEMLPIHNFYSPADMVIDGEKVRAGTWLIGSLVLSADLWQRVDSGELNAWSVDGRALRRPEAIAA